VRDVFRHRHDHLAHGLGLRAVAVLQLVEFGDTVDEHGDLFAELLAQGLELVVGVFDGVVQQRRGDGLRSDAQVGKDLRDGHGVRDVRLSAAALLPAVRELGSGVGALDERDVGFRVVQAHGLDEQVDRSCGLGPREDARNEAAQ
jgi:hypothetical protein